MRKAIPSTYTEQVKMRVWERDGGRCVICGSPYAASPCGQYVPELFIPENVVTLCMPCKCGYDNSPKRPFYRSLIKRYLKLRYPNWDESKLVFKGGNYEYRNSDW